MSEEELREQACRLMREALSIIDQLNPPVEIGAHVDLALSRLSALMDEAHPLARPELSPIIPQM